MKYDANFCRFDFKSQHSQLQMVEAKFNKNCLYSKYQHKHTRIEFVFVFEFM